MADGSWQGPNLLPRAVESAVRGRNERARQDRVACGNSFDHVPIGIGTNERPYGAHGGSREDRQETRNFAQFLLGDTPELGEARGYIG
jgi:hypothetical protein